ncbi:MAG TPA: hypothetical protein VGT61_12655 [Thermomicrobiales bacterium]|nr:hypothetical protein [Thermomicrobiales bacterium]
MRLIGLLRWSVWTLIGVIAAWVLVTNVDGLSGLIGPLVVVSLIVLVLALVLDAERIRRRPFEFTANVPVPAHEVLDQADTWFDGRGWDLQDSEEDRVIVSREPEPNRMVIGMLFLAGIIPGLIYLWVTRDPQPVTLTIHPEARTGGEVGSAVHMTGTGQSAEAVAFFRSIQVGPPAGGA